MPVVAIRSRARIDIMEIWEYIAEDSEARADAFVRRLHGQCRLLAAQPGLGRSRAELLAGVRSFPFGRYVLFYLATPAGIELVRVLHSARDVKSQFGPDA